MPAHPAGDSHPSFSEVDHRPWPLPRGRWSWSQSWCDLLFAHWPVPVAAVRPLVPAALAVQTFDGSAWVTVVPFRMVDVTRRPWPPVPGLSTFPELNVRVYVEAGGKPGVFFLSLDAANPLVVWFARTFFHVPYFQAQMELVPDGEGFHGRCRRRAGSSGATAPAQFEVRYRPVSAARAAQPGTLEYFLTERYCLYAHAPDGSLYRAEVHHKPWPLQQAEAEIMTNTIPAADGLPLAGPPALLHFARRIDVALWGSVRVE